MNNTDKYKRIGTLTIFDSQMNYVNDLPLVEVTLKFDSVGKALSTLQVLDKVNLLTSTTKGYCSFVTNGIRLFGKILEVAVDSADIVLEVALHYDVLDKPVYISEGTYSDIENTLKNILLTEYSGTDPKENLPLVFDLKTTTSGYIVSPDGILDFSTLVDQVMRVHNIYVTLVFVNTYILVTIERKIKNKITRYTEGIENIKYNFDEAQVTKLTYKSTTGTIYNYYLLKDGSITDNVNHVDRVDFVKENKELLEAGATTTDILNKAKNELEKTYANEIEIEYDLDKEEVVDIFNLINQPVDLVLPNGNVLNTMITKITKSSSTHWVQLTLGTSRQRLTDKLKKRVK